MLKHQDDCNASFKDNTFYDSFAKIQFEDLIPADLSGIEDGLKKDIAE